MQNIAYLVNAARVVIFYGAHRRARPACPFPRPLVSKKDMAVVRRIQRDIQRDSIRPQQHLAWRMDGEAEERKLELSHTGEQEITTTVVCPCALRA